MSINEYEFKKVANYRHHSDSCDEIENLNYLSSFVYSSIVWTLLIFCYFYYFYCYSPKEDCLSILKTNPRGILKKELINYGYDSSKSLT